MTAHSITHYPDMPVYRATSVAAYEFTSTITLCDFGDTEVPADFSADSDGNITLEQVKLGGQTVTAEWLRDMIGGDELTRQIGFVQLWWSDAGWAAADADAVANEADYWLGARQ